MFCQPRTRVKLNWVQMGILKADVSYLEEIMRAVTSAWAIPRVKVNGFFLTMATKIRGRQMVE